MATSNSTATCPHCGKESERRALTSINIDQNPEMRGKVQDLSCFRWECPNCGVTSLVVDPCLYHDMSNQFMVWLSPEDKQPENADFEPLSGYTMRYVADLNTFREKITILERGLDDRAVEIMKLIAKFAFGLFEIKLFERGIGCKRIQKISVKRESYNIIDIFIIIRIRRDQGI